jgi:hypothetical protein
MRRKERIDERVDDRDISNSDSSPVTKMRKFHVELDYLEAVTIEGDALARKLFI